MMQRNVVVKKAPQRFQDEKDLSKIDICICFDDRVFDAVLESMAPCCFWSVDLQFRACHGMKPLLVLNMHTQDKPAMAEGGAHYALRLNKCQDNEQEACDIKKRFEAETGLCLLFNLFYIWWFICFFKLTPFREWVWRDVTDGVWIRRLTLNESYSKEKHRRKSFACPNYEWLEICA